MLRVEKERQSIYEQLRDAALESLTEKVRIFTTDELLEYPDDVGWVCYHDEVAAFIDVQHFIVLYHGYDGYWG